MLWSFIDKERTRDKVYGGFLHPYTGYEALVKEIHYAHHTNGLVGQHDLCILVMLHLHSNACLFHCKLVLHSKALDSLDVFLKYWDYVDDILDKHKIMVVENSSSYIKNNTQLFKLDLKI